MHKPDQSSANTLNEVRDYFDGLKGQGAAPLDWNYLDEKLGLFIESDVPPVDVPLAVLDVKIDGNNKRLFVHFSYTYGANITIDSVLVTYWGKFVDESQQGDLTWGLYVGINVINNLGIDDVPVAGHLEGGSFGLQAIQLLVTSTNMTGKECANLYTWVQGYIPEIELGQTDYTKPPMPGPKEMANGIESRAIFRVVVAIIGDEYPVEIEVIKSQVPLTYKSSLISKSIGSFKILRLEMSYDFEQNILSIQIDAEIDWGPIKLILQNFQIQIYLNPPYLRDPYATISGMEFVYANDGFLTIGGGLYKNNTWSTQYLDMGGSLTVSIKDKFQFLLMGAYAPKTANGKASLFGFGFVGWPIPAPDPFGFQGLAGGGAYNRDLILPTVDKLDQFPFIQAAMAFAEPNGAFKNPFPSDYTDPAGLVNTLHALDDEIAPPKDGIYWGVVGAAFSVISAGRLIKAFALLSGLGGAKTRISAVGELQLSMPPTGFGTNEEKLVFIDTFFELIIDISGKMIGFDAYIKYNSFIVEKNIHVTGGLSLRIWWGDVGSSGHFLISAGGYAPNLNLSSFPQYPNVPRLAITMDLGNLCQAKGKSYFAVTQAMVMWGVAFQISRKVAKVEFWGIVCIDALIAWHPFQYNLYGSIEIGATFSIHVWFVHISITVHVGASLHIWGPPLSGRVRFDVCVATISLPFGANADNSPQPLNWSQFKEQHLPKVPAGTEPLDPGQQTYAVAHVEVMSNNTIVLERKILDDIAWIVDPETVAIVTHASIPSKAWSATVFRSDPQTGNADNPDFGVAPCNIKASSFHTTHEVEIATDDGGGTFQITPQTGSVSPALWGDGMIQLTDPNEADNVVDNVIVGLRFDPIHTSPDRTLPADAEQLLSDHDTLDLPYLLANTDHSSDFSGVSISGSIASAKAANNRRSLFGSLKQLLLNNEMPDITADTVNVSGFANGNDTDLFISSPLMRLLGEDRTS